MGSGRPRPAAWTRGGPSCWPNPSPADVGFPDGPTSPGSESSGSSAFPTPPTLSFRACLTAELVVSPSGIHMVPTGALRSGLWADVVLAVHRVAGPAEPVCPARCSRLLRPWPCRARAEAVHFLFARDLQRLGSSSTIHRPQLRPAPLLEFFRVTGSFWHELRPRPYARTCLRAGYHA